MADWYFSSAKYATLTLWAASHAYSVGDIIRPTAPATNAQYTYRCTTAGTSGTTEPSWPTSNNSTVTNGGATFTNVTGQSTYGWNAAGGALYGCLDRQAVGDRVFLSSDHSETQSIGGNTIWTFTATGNSYGTVYVYSVNRAGSVPPVAADIQAGANLGTSASSYSGMDGGANAFYQGVTFTHGGSANNFYIYNGAIRNLYCKDCTFAFTTGGNGTFITSSGNPKVTFDNTKVTFNTAGCNFAAYTNLSINWINTPSAFSGTQPTSLFTQSSSGQMPVIMRGVDLSFLTGTLFAEAITGGQKHMYEGCKFNPSVTFASLYSGGPTGSELECINCYNGTNTFSRRETHAGVVTTDRSTYLNSGGQDDSGYYSLKLVSNANSDLWALPLEAFWLDVENAAVGVAKTATIEIASAALLRSNEIKLMLEYLGTSGSPVTSFADSYANPVTLSTLLPASANTWAGSPATMQVLQVSFTPQRAGRVRGLVKLGKVSTTVWINPQITLS